MTTPLDRWSRAIAESHTITTRVECYRLDLPMKIADLGIIDGTLTQKAGDEIRRSAELTVIDEAGVLGADTAEDILSPLSVEVKIIYGIVYPDGTTEEVSCGLFPVFHYSMVQDGGRHMYRITCYDRSKRATVAFGRPYSTIPGAPLEKALHDLVKFKTPTLLTDFPTTGFTVPALVFDGGSNPWKEAVELAKLSGYVLEVNRFTGVFNMRPAVMDVGRSAQWDFVDDERAAAWDVESEFDMDQAPNHVIVRGTGTANPVEGEAWDADPQSPTWIGRIGKRTKEVSSEKIRTQDQAKRAAQAILGRDLGKSKTHPLKALPNAQLELDQTIHLRQMPYAIDTLALVDSIDLPLTADKEMSVEVRRGVKTDEEVAASVVAA